MSSMTNSNELTTMYTNVEVNRLSFTELKEGKNSKGQKAAYPLYNHPSAGADSPLFIQFPWINMSTYGIPKIGEYVKTDSDRLYIKCPLDLSLSEVNDLYTNLIVKLDDYLSSEQVKDKLFGKKALKYEYNPIFKTPRINDDDDEEIVKPKSTSPKPPFLKLKFDVSYPDNNMKTKVFKTLPDCKREKLDDIITISDMEKIVCWRCRFRPIVRLSKVWAQTVGTGKNGPGYGVSLTIIKIEVEPPSNNGLSLKYTKYQGEDTFLEDDSKSFKNPKVELKKTPQIVDSDESDEESIPVSKKRTPIVNSDDEDNKKTKTISKKSTQIVESESDEETIKPKTVKKPTQIVESEEESEEEIKPVKQVKNRTVSKKK